MLTRSAGRRVTVADATRRGRASRPTARAARGVARTRPRPTRGPVGAQTFLRSSGRSRRAACRRLCVRAVPPSALLCATTGERAARAGATRAACTHVQRSYSRACTIISNLSRSLTSSASGDAAFSYSSHSASISAAAAGDADRFATIARKPSCRRARPRSQRPPHAHAHGAASRVRRRVTHARARGGHGRRRRQRRDTPAPACTFPPWTRPRAASDRPRCSPQGPTSRRRSPAAATASRRVLSVRAYGPWALRTRARARAQHTYVHNRHAHAAALFATARVCARAVW